MSLPPGGESSTIHNITHKFINSYKTNKMKKILINLAIVVAALCSSTIADAQKIRTIAGTPDSNGYSGDGAMAIHAMLGGSWGIAADANGNIFIADDDMNVIRKIQPSGEISTIAGMAYPGFSGDGGPATAAHLNYPSGLALDGHGNLYVADNGNYVIRKIDAAGVITTVAGTGVWGYSGDGGLAVSARLNGCVGLAFDRAGNMYIADGNTRIRKVTPAGYISTVAGGSMWGFSGDGGRATEAALSGPCGVSVDTMGNIYFSDQLNNVIRKVSVSGIITTIAGTTSGGYGGDNGPATRARLNTPGGVFADNSGNVFFADEGNNRVRKISPDGTITTVAGNGTYDFAGDEGLAINAALRFPSALCMNAAGNMFITDRKNYVIREVLSPGSVTIGAYPNNELHTGSEIIFTAPASITEYGVACQWQLNGMNVGAGESTYSNPSIKTGDVVTCSLIDVIGGGAVLDISNAITVVDGSLETAQLASKNTNLDISVYPNPNNGNFQVTGSFASKIDENVSYGIYDVTGKLIYQGYSAPQNGKINEQLSLNSQLPTGHYILRASSLYADKELHFEINK